MRHLTLKYISVFTGLIFLCSCYSLTERKIKKSIRANEIVQSDTFYTINMERLYVLCLDVLKFEDEIFKSRKGLRFLKNNLSKDYYGPSLYFTGGLNNLKNKVGVWTGYLENKKVMETAYLERTKGESRIIYYITWDLKGNELESVHYSILE